MKKRYGISFKLVEDMQLLSERGIIYFDFFLFDTEKAPNIFDGCRYHSIIKHT